MRPRTLASVCSGRTIRSASQPRTDPRSIRRWRADTPVFRHFVRFAVDRGGAKTAIAWPLSVSNHCSELRGSTSAGMAEHPDNAIAADPIHGSAVSSAPECVVPSWGGQWTSLRGGNVRRRRSAQAFRESVVTVRAARSTFRSTVSGWHIHQSRRHIPALGSEYPRVSRIDRERHRARRVASARESSRLPARGRAKTGHANETNPPIALALVSDEVPRSVRLLVVHEEPVDGGLSLIHKGNEPGSHPTREERKESLPRLHQTDHRREQIVTSGASCTWPFRSR